MSMGDLVVGFVMLGIAALLIGGFIGLVDAYLKAVRARRKLELEAAALHKTESTTTTMPDTRAYLETVTDDGQRQWKRPAL